MALGLPDRGVRLPAVREIVEEGENALLVPVEDQDRLAEAIDLDPRGPQPGSRLRATQPKIFLERFTSTRSAEAMIDLYRHLAPGSTREAAGAR